MGRPLYNRVTYGDAIVSRFAAITVPKLLAGDLTAFKAQHGLFLKANAAVAKTEKAYDDAAAKLAALDAGRDATVLSLADKIPGAGLGTRTRPFARFSKYAPTKLVSLPYAAETLELSQLLAKIAAAKPPADIAKLCDKARQQNEQVDQALDALTKPLASLDEARSKRDAAIPDWEKHLRRLKDASKVAFRDENGRMDALFAEPDGLQTNVRSRKRAKKPIDGAAEAAAEPKKAKRRKRRTG